MTAAELFAEALKWLFETEILEKTGVHVEMSVEVQDMQENKKPRTV